MLVLPAGKLGNIWKVKLYDLTVFRVDQVVTAAGEGPVDSVAGLRAGQLLRGQIDTNISEEARPSATTSAGRPL